MNIHALGPATLGFGFGVAMLWAVRSATVNEWLGKVREALQRKAGRSDFHSVCARDLQWARNQLHQEKVTYFMKPLLHHPHSDESIMLVRYPAGQVNPSHVHSLAGHAMYVLSGTLVTHRGSYGPDTMVWFPPNEVMWHGAGPDEELVALFIVGRDFTTRYVDKH